MKTLLKLALIILCFPVLAEAQTSTITWGTTHQTMDGFGAQTWKSANNLNSVQVDMFFSTTAGIGLEYVRTANTSDGSIPDLVTLQAAVARGARVELGLQSPPANLKYSNDFNNGSAGASGGCIDPANFSAWATYIVNYINTLQGQGIPIAVLDVQNEPDIASSSLGACILTAQLFDQFIATNLGPALSSAGLSPAVMMPSPAGWNTNLSSNCMFDSNCAQYISIVGGHGYGNGDTNSWNNSGYCCGVIQPPPANAGKKVWQSEINGGFTFNSGAGLWTFDASIADAIAAVHNLHTYLTQANASGWLYWELADCCNGPYNDGLTDGSFNPAKRMYAVGNYSKFVRTGWVRIDASDQPAANVYVTAFNHTSDGAFAIVAVNNNGSSQSVTFSLSGFPSAPSAVTPWITSSTLNLVQQTNATVTANSFTYSLPANSITTFTGNASSPSASDFYIAQTAQGAADGSSCPNAYAVTFFNTGANWGGGAGQIGPDKTVHLCGTFTGTGGSTMLTAQGSGTSGHPITIVCDPGGVILTAPYWAGNPSGAIALGTNSYITMTGTNCTLNATQNGTGLAFQNATYGITHYSPGTNVTVSNWTISNLYNRIAGGHELPDNSVVRPIDIEGANDVVDGVTISQCGWAVNMNGDNAILRNSSISGCGHGASMNSVHWKMYNNHIFNFANWNSDNDSYHQDGVHCFGGGTTGITQTAYIYNNRFDGSTGANMNQFIFLEGNTSPDRCMVAGGTVYIFNNVGIADGATLANFALYGNATTGDSGDIYVNNLSLGLTNSDTTEAVSIQNALTTRIENNASGGTGILVAGGGSFPATYTAFDYNAYENCNSFNCFFIGTVDTGSFTTWQASSYCSGSPNSCDQHGIANLSLSNYFTLPAACVPGSIGANCAPQTGSPLVGAGANLFSICNGQPSPGLGDMCKDINGVSRPNGAWTIGPYQIAGNPSASLPSCLPAGGTFTSGQSITCTAATGPTLCYTTNSVNPVTNGTTGCTTGTLVSGAISIPSTTTLKVIAGGTGFTDGAIATNVYTIQTVAANPSCSPGTGSYSSGQSVSCNTSSSGAGMVYTTDGSTPVISPQHGTTYSGAISISSTSTLKIIAGNGGYSPSSVVTYAYTITVPTASSVVCSPGSGTYTSTQTVGCTAATGPTQCYTLNGANPQTNGTTGCTVGTKYTTTISIASSQVLKIVSGGTAFLDGPITTYTYTITTQAADPVCSPGTGSYVGSVSTNCSDSSSGATMVYTTDGSTPVISPQHGISYSGTISFSATTTLKIIGGNNGYTPSNVVTYTFTISGPPTASTPVCVPGSGIFSSSQSVSCTSSTGPTLCYSTSTTPATNGTTGCTVGTLYTGAISVASNTTLRVIAGGTGFTDGSVATYSYTITPPFASTPVCTPVGGTYPQSQSVTCTAATGPTLCYSTTTTPKTNGTTGCTTGTLYTGAITVSSTSTLNVVAGGTSYTDGSVATYAYTITQPNNGAPWPLSAYLIPGNHGSCPVCALKTACICQAKDGFWMSVNGSAYKLM